MSLVLVFQFQAITDAAVKKPGFQRLRANQYDELRRQLASGGTNIPSAQVREPAKQSAVQSLNSLGTSSGPVILSVPTIQDLLSPQWTYF